MAAIGIGLVWVSYTSILYGYCLFRGYDVTPKMLLSPTWPPADTTSSTKPKTKGSSTTKSNPTVTV